MFHFPRLITCIVYSVRLLFYTIFSLNKQHACSPHAQYSGCLLSRFIQSFKSNQRANSSNQMHVYYSFVFYDSLTWNGWLLWIVTVIALRNFRRDRAGVIKRVAGAAHRCDADHAPICSMMPFLSEINGSIQLLWWTYHATVEAASLFYLQRLCVKSIVRFHRVHA